MQRINISVEDNLLSRLDSYAKKCGYTRSGLIATAVNEYIFAKEKEPEISKALEELKNKIDDIVNQK